MEQSNDEGVAAEPETVEIVTETDASGETAEHTASEVAARTDGEGAASPIEPEVTGSENKDPNAPGSRRSTAKTYLGLTAGVIGFLGSITTLAQAADLIGGPSIINVVVSIFSNSTIEVADDTEEPAPPTALEDDSTTTVSSAVAATEVSAAAALPPAVPSTLPSTLPSTTVPPKAVPSTATSSTAPPTTPPSSAAATSAAPGQLIIAMGQSNEATITGPGEVHRWSFANPDDAMSLILDLVHLGSAGECELDLEARVVNANGRDVSTAGILTGDCNAHQLALSGPGDYELILQAGDGSTVPTIAGTYRFVPSLSRPADRAVVNLDGVNSGTIEAVFGRDEWTLDVTSPGSKLELVMLTAGQDRGCLLDLNWQLIDPQGVPVWPDVLAGGNMCGEPIVRDLPVAGQYVLQFWGGSGYVIDQRTGPYSFTVSVG